MHVVIPVSNSHVPCTGQFQPVYKTHRISRCLISSDKNMLGLYKENEYYASEYLKANILRAKGKNEGF
jgi:hypothetical protein